MGTGAGGFNDAGVGMDGCDTAAVTGAGGGGDIMVNGEFPVAATTGGREALCASAGMAAGKFGAAVKGAGAGFMVSGLVNGETVE